MRTAIMVLVLAICPDAAASAQAPVRLEPVLRIGCAACDGAALFAGIQALALAEDRIYVADRSAPHVRVFDLSGRSVRSFGRTGAGPGELRLPIHIGVRADGIQVYDMTQRRLTRYDTAGAVVATRTVPGFAVLAASLPGSSWTYLLTTDFRTTDQPIVRLSDDQTEPQLVTMLRADFPRLAQGEHARTPAFAARPGGGITIGDGIAEYRIRRFDVRGTALPDIVREIPKSRKSPVELEEERLRLQRRAARMQAMLRAEGARGGAPPAPREERNHFNIDALAHDETGRLWVRTERGGSSATVFDLFDAEGRHLGEVRVEGWLGTFVVGGGRLAAVTRDAEEVEYVGLWRVR